MKMLHLKNIETAIIKLTNVDLPIKIAYQLNVIIDDIQKHLNRLQKFRVSFINKHGERIDNDHTKIPTEKIREFDQGMEELLQEEIDINPVAVPLSMIIDTNIKFTVMEIESLKKAGFLVDDINSNEE